MAELKLVRETNYGRVGILGKPEEVGYAWLQCQEIPFDDDAVFMSMYPLEGGMMIVDSNKVQHLGAPSEEQMDEILCRKEGFNPAAETIKKMMEEGE